MSDPNWNNDRYYGNTFPRVGMQHARYIGVTFGRGFLNTARLGALLIYAQVFTVCYLLQGGGPEWANRFGHRRAHPNLPPDFCPDFLIETYLDRQGEKFCTRLAMTQTHCSISQR